MKLHPGNILKANSGSHYLVLKVEDNSYAQNAFDGKMGTQSHNIPKETIVTTWDGKFTNRISLTELYKNCETLVEISNLEEGLELVNSSY